MKINYEVGTGYIFGTLEEAEKFWEIYLKKTGILLGLAETSQRSNYRFKDGKMRKIYRKPLQTKKDWQYARERAFHIARKIGLDVENPGQDKFLEYAFPDGFDPLDDELADWLKVFYGYY